MSYTNNELPRFFVYNKSDLFNVAKKNTKKIEKINIKEFDYHDDNVNKINKVLSLFQIRDNRVNNFLYDNVDKFERLNIDVLCFSFILYINNQKKISKNKWTTKDIEEEIKDEKYKMYLDHFMKLKDSKLEDSKFYERLSFQVETYIQFILDLITV